ncbi:MAG: hypothetical protein IPJ65_13720 [Archangiaceae bacterium]|nr:hypothetical protein [Archangiaceae bacterium]
MFFAFICLTVSIFDDLEAGRMPAQSIDSLASAYPEVSLNGRLANEFYRRFKDKGLEAKAKALLGTTLEAVRKMRT